MELLTGLVLAGLANGAIYALLALALVTIFKAIHHINFAQGEMATFSTFVAWTLLGHGVDYWSAFLITLLLSFCGGVFVERVLFRSLREAPALSHVIAYLGLYMVVNSLSGWLWGHTVKPFPSPFPYGSVAGLIGYHELGVLVVAAVLILILFAFFQYTALGLTMRAAVDNPESAGLAGISVGWMQAVAWGLAAAIGAVAGMLIAPVLFLEPGMMGGVLIYSLAALVLGGVQRPLGAVVGGLLVGVGENLLGVYMPGVGNELKLTAALIVIFSVLSLRPQGLFGHATARNE